MCVSASEQASNKKAAAEVVMEALSETDRAQNVAMEAIQLAQNNTKGTMDLVDHVSLTSVILQSLLLPPPGLF